MKKYTFFVVLTFTALILAFSGMTSCEGPAGADGIDGVAGTDGAAGADGADGMDMDASCKVCHDDGTDLFVKSLQAGASIHMTGGNFERNGADCAACHTHEGFVDRMEAGEMEASTDVVNPSSINCRTCHNIHTAYDATDWAVTYTDPVALWVGGETADLGGDANLCLNCHQARIASPAAVVGGADVSLTSSRWGPHHGPQGSVLYGTAAYEFAVASVAAAGTHQHAGVGCTTCHMAEAYGTQAGGHTFDMTYTYHGADAVWTAGCVSCHSASTFGHDIEVFQEETEHLLDSLHTILVANGWVNASDGLITASSSAPLALTADQAGAVWNFYFFEEDRSLGVHNPPYVTALILASITAASK